MMPVALMGTWVLNCVPEVHRVLLRDHACAE